MKRNLLLTMVLALFAWTGMSAQIISQYIETNSGTTPKGLEIWNNTDASLDFASKNLEILKGGNGGAFQNVTTVSTGTLNAGAVMIIGTSDMEAVATSTSVAFNLKAFSFNGDDALAVVYGGDTTDVFGTPGKDPGSEWVGNSVSTKNSNIALKVGITTGDTDGWSDPSERFEYIAAGSDLTGFGVAPVIIDATIPDTIPPVWATDYPMSGNANDTSFQMLFKLNEPGVVYGVIYDEEQATMPTLAEVLAAARSGQGADSVLIPSTAEVAYTISGDVGDTSHIYVFAVDTSGNIDSTVIYFTGVPEKQPILIASENFDGSLGAFTEYSVVGDQKWAAGEYGGISYAKISGYTSSANANEDWLISPVINLDDSEGEFLNFESARNYGDAALQLEVKYSTDYTGAGDPTTATWTALDAVVATEDGYKWTSSGDVDLSTMQGDFYIAFVYTSTTESAPTWEVANIQVYGFIDETKDATLASLSVYGSEIEGFDPGVKDYVYHLPVNHTEVPAVEAEAKVDGAMAVVTPASDLNGDAAARTTTIEVTATDGVTKETYTILFNPAVAASNIAEIKAGDENRIYGLANPALVTVTNSYRNRRFIQDESGAIMIYDASGVITTDIAAGDSILGVIGKLGKVSGMTVFVPDSAIVTVLSSGNEVMAEEVTIAAMEANADAYMHKYIKVTDAAFVEPEGEFSNGKNYDITDAADTMVLRTDFYGAVSGPIPTATGDISGVLLAYYSTLQLVPTSNDDLDFAAPEITGFTPIPDIVLDSNLNVVEMYNLSELGLLPETIELLYDGGSVTVDVENWYSPDEIDEWEDTVGTFTFAPFFELSDDYMLSNYEIFDTALTLVINVPQTYYALNVPFTEDFEAAEVGKAFEAREWYNYDDEGEKYWNTKFSSAQNSNYVEMTSYQSPDAKNAVWLETPFINMANTSNEELTFDVLVSYYDTACLTILLYDFETDSAYDITSQFTLPTMPTDAEGAWVNAGTADLSSYSGLIYLAFVYEGNPTDATTLIGLDNISITEGATAIHKVAANTVAVYPNPAVSAIQLSADVEALELINLSGKTVLAISNVAARQSVDISSIENGVYFVKARVNGTTEISKLIKK